MLDRLAACTKWCLDVCPALHASPPAIVADSWSADGAQILAARPDMVMASVPYQLEAVGEILQAGIPFLGLAPHNLADIYTDIAKIAALMGVPERGAEVIREMQDDIAQVSQKAATVTNGSRPRVYCEEWGKPLIRSQGWVAELIEAAGGEFLGVPGAHATESEVRAAAPDVILAAWCGAGDRVPLEKIIPARGWQETPAAKARRIYCINDEYLNTPAPNLTDGLHAIAAAIHPEHPELFPAPAGLRRIR